MPGRFGYIPCPYRFLAAAIIRRAWLDGARGSEGARQWLLFDPWARMLYDYIGLHYEQVRRKVLAGEWHERELMRDEE